MTFQWLKYTQLTPPHAVSQTTTLIINGLFFRGDGLDENTVVSMEKTKSIWSQNQWKNI